MIVNIALLKDLQELLDLCKEFEQEFDQIKEAQGLKTLKKKKQDYKKIKKLIPLLAKETDKILTVSTEDDFSIDDGFGGLIEAYNKACTEGTLTAEKAKELTEKMKVLLKKNITDYNELLATFKSNKDDANVEETVRRSRQKIKTRKEQLQNLTTDCIKAEGSDIIIDAPSDDLLKVSELDQAYEEVIEQGIKMSTGPSVDIADTYETALEKFTSLYNDSSKGEQSKWKQAKKEVDENIATLKAKREEATQTVDAWKTQMQANGIRGYFRYAEGVVNGELIRRMDWVMASTGTYVSPSSGDGDAGQDGDNYQGGEIIIESYTLTGDANGDLVYTHTGKVTTMTARMFELAAMLRSAFYGEGVDFDMKPGTGQPFCGNEGAKDKNSSVMLRTAAKPIPQVVEIPDWTDGGFEETRAIFDAECGALDLAKDQADELRDKLRAAIKMQEENIEALKTISENLGGRDDILILIQIWEKRKLVCEKKLEWYEKKEECVKVSKYTPPTCTDIETVLTTYEKSCIKGTLPRVLARDYWESMNTCLEERKTIKIEQEKELAKVIEGLKKSPSSPRYKAEKIIIEARIVDLEAYIAKYKRKVENIRKTVEDKSSWGCLKTNVSFSIVFVGDSNGIISGDSAIRKYLTEVVVPALNDEPRLRVVVTGHVGSNKNIKDAEGNAVREGTIDQDAIREYEKGSKKIKDPYYSDPAGTGLSRAAILGNLMLLRAGAIGQILEKVHSIPSSQIVLEKGTYMDKDSNRKVSISFSM